MHPTIVIDPATQQEWQESRKLWIAGMLQKKKLSMKHERKIFVVGGDTGYINWMEGHAVGTMEAADLVCFTGGEDVDPRLYKRPKHATCSCNPLRDAREVAAFRKAQALGKPLIGICRGSQFLCVMAGGLLVQHQENPLFLHKMSMSNGRQLNVTSTHHQAQYPWLLKEDDFKIIGWTEHISKFHYDGSGEELVNGMGGLDGKRPGLEDLREVEVACYPHIKALAIQSHPEMLMNNPQDNHGAMDTINWMRTILNMHMKGLL